MIGCGTTGIDNNANSNMNSYSNLGHSYTTPVGTYGSTEANNFLAGSYQFTFSDYEVFQAVPLENIAKSINSYGDSVFGLHQEVFDNVG